MAKPAPELLQRARRYYDLEPRQLLEREGRLVEAGRLGDVTLIAARGHGTIPALVKDQVREERATRHWFAHRQGGWTPIDIVLRSPLHETETWYDSRGQH